MQDTRSGALPLVLHFNGDAKKSMEDISRSMWYSDSRTGAILPEVWARVRASSLIVDGQPIRFEEMCGHAIQDLLPRDTER